MIIVENNSEISHLISEFNLDFGAVKLDSASLEVSNLLNYEFYVIAIEELQKMSESTFAALSNTSGVVVCGDGELPHSKLSNIIYHHGTNSDKKILHNQLVLLQELISQSEVMRSQLTSLNRELAQMTGSLEHELLRLKKAHERKTPRRFEEVKGINFYSKYSAGESMGGEFFDMFKVGSHIFILMSSTSSYLASSSILTFFTALKMEEGANEQKQVKFINELKTEIDKINANRAKPVNAHILTAIIDLSNYKVSGYNLGNFGFKSSLGKEYAMNSQKNSLLTDLESAKFEIQLSRLEKLMLSSPGFLQNWEKLDAEFMPEDILTKPGIKALDILDELFFQMKKDSESGFLEQDASVILLEVDRNVMVQI